MDNKGFLHENIQHKKVIIASISALIVSFFSLILLPSIIMDKIIFLPVICISSFLLSYSLNNRHKEMTYNHLLKSLMQVGSLSLECLAFALRKINKYLSVKSFASLIVFYLILFQVCPLLIEKAMISNKFIFGEVTYHTALVNIQNITIALGYLIIGFLSVYLAFVILNYMIVLLPKRRMINKTLDEISKLDITIPYHHIKGKCILDSDRLLDLLLYLSEDNETIQELYRTLKHYADYFNEWHLEINRL